MDGALCPRQEQLAAPSSSDSTLGGLSGPTMVSVGEISLPVLPELNIEFLNLDVRLEVRSPRPHPNAKAASPPALCALLGAHLECAAEVGPAGRGL